MSKEVALLQDPANKSSARWVPAALLGFLAVVGLYVFLQSPFFAIRDVVVEGHRVLQSEEVMAIAGVRKGDNLLRLDGTRARDRLAADPRIAEARITRQIPGSVSISILERQPVAILPYADGFLLVDREGVLMASDTRSLPQVPLLTGLDPEAAAAGNDDGRLAVASRVAGLLPIELRAAVSEVHVGNVDDVVLYTGEGTVVRLGEGSQLDEKITLLASLLAQYDQRSIELEIVDLRYPGSPVVRQKR